MIIKSIEPWSAAKIVGGIYAIIGFVMGLLASMSAFMFAVFGRFGMHGMWANSMMPGVPYFAFILWPIFYGIAGFVGTLVFAYLYNLLAGYIGGIELKTR